MLRKNFLFEKTKNTNGSDNKPLPTSENAADLLGKKELDKKLVYSLNKNKIPSLKQLKYLPTVLNNAQKKIVGGLTVLIIVCLIFIAGNFYYRNFLPVPKTGGEITIGVVGAPQYINPLLCQTNDVDSDISRLIFSGLLKYDNNLEPAADLTESWQNSEDQKSYTFKLKKGLKWQDGQPLTADDVVFTFQSIKDQEFKSPLLISVKGIEIEKIDELTVKLTLPQPYPDFLDVLTFGILPSHVWSEIPPINANLTEYNLKPVGSGPWKFKSLAKDKLGNIKSYVLVVNQNYYAKKPYLEKITFRFYPDFETAVSALKSHSIDSISFLPKYLRPELNGQKNLAYYSANLPQYTAIFFNQNQNSILKDKNLRKALALSIDKKKILNDALQLDGQIIDGPIFSFDDKLTANNKLEYDDNQANKILDDAAWQKITPQEYKEFLDQQAQKAKQEEEKTKNNQVANTNTTSTTNTTSPQTEELSPEEKADQENKTTQTFYRKNKDTILELTLTTVGQSENTKTAELIKNFWERIGVKVNLNIVDGNRINREIIKPRNYEVLLYGIIVGSNQIGRAHV